MYTTSGPAMPTSATLREVRRTDQAVVTCTNDNRVVLFQAENPILMILF
jgi:hypothetical protein